MFEAESLLVDRQRHGYHLPPAEARLLDWTAKSILAVARALHPDHFYVPLGRKWLLHLQSRRRILILLYESQNINFRNVRCLDEPPNDLFGLTQVWQSEKPFVS